jgi:hypothetical protein
MVILGIVLLIFFFFLVLIIYEFQKKSEEVIPSAVLGSIITLCFIAVLVIIGKHFYSSITPIDVYRGKTTLEITYRDGFAIDSTVVWKEEIK